VRKLYVLVMFTWLCLLWNWITVMSAWFAGGAEGSNALESSIWLILGVPLSWRLWYRSIYYATRDNSSKNWIFFFINFFLHMCWCIVMGLGVPSTAGAGLFYFLRQFTNSNKTAGVFGLAAMAAWGINLGVSFVLVKGAHQRWKQSGGDRRAVTEAAQYAVHTEMRDNANV